jgi:antirestriction protein ArdC
VLGAQVRKGERGTVSIFYRTYRPQEVGDNDQAEGDRSRRVLKSFSVFNTCQIQGLPDRFSPGPRPLPPATERDHILDAFFAAVPARIRHVGAEAFYSPASDQVTMPEPGLFRDLNHYRATLAHELSHWTGHESRLARQMRRRFGSDAYAMEELVAELSSAMLGAELGLPVEHLDHHASYLASWLKVMKADSRAILTIAAKAEEAASLLLRLGRKQAPAAVAQQADAEDIDALAA